MPLAIPYQSVQHYYQLSMHKHSSVCVLCYFLVSQELSRCSSVCVLCNVLFLGMCARVPLARVCYTLIGSTADHEQTQQHLCALRCFVSGVSVHVRTGATCTGFAYPINAYYFILCMRPIHHGYKLSPVLISWPH